MSLVDRTDMPIPTRGETCCNDPDLLLLSRPDGCMAHLWDVPQDDRCTGSYPEEGRFNPYWPEVEW